MRKTTKKATTRRLGKKKAHTKRHGTKSLQSTTNQKPILKQRRKKRLSETTEPSLASLLNQLVTPPFRDARLTIELVPETCWYSNVRSNVTQQEWDYLRRPVYQRAGYPSISRETMVAVVAADLHMGGTAGTMAFRESDALAWLIEEATKDSCSNVGLLVIPSLPSAFENSTCLNRIKSAR